MWPKLPWNNIVSRREVALKLYTQRMWKVR